MLLRDSGKPLLSANAAFRSYQDGVLTLSARSDFWARSVETSLSDLSINQWFPGFRTLQVRVDSGGQTGREKLAIQDVERRQNALQAARTSDAVKSLTTVLGGTLDEEGVEPPPLVIQDELEGLEIAGPDGMPDLLGDSQL